MALSVGSVVANIYYVQPLLPDVARSFDLSVRGVAAVAMLGMAGAGLGQIVFVPLGDIRERRGLIVGMTAAAAIACALAAAAQNGAWMMAAMLLLGVTASVNHVTIPYAAHLAPPARRGRVVGTVISGLLVGILLARAWAGWIGEVFSWRVVFGMASVAMTVLAVLMRRYLPESHPETRLNWPQLIASVLPLWRQLPGLRESVIVNCLMFCAFNAFWTSLVFFVEAPPYSYTSRGAGLFGLIGVVGALGAPFAGRLTDRYGGRGNVLVAVLAMSASFVVLGLWGMHLTGLIVGVLVLDLAQQLGHVSNQTRIYGLVPEARSRLNMVYMTFSFTGGAAGSYFGTFWWHSAGWWGVCGFGIGLMALALFAWWRVGRVS